MFVSLGLIVKEDFSDREIFLFLFEKQEVKFNE